MHNMNNYHNYLISYLESQTKNKVEKKNILLTLISRAFGLSASYMESWKF